MSNRIVIGSRGSKLALWQAEWVKTQIEQLSPESHVQIEIIKTSGDRLKDAPLSVIGGQGVFTKEIEEALLSGRIDVAVHSLKDLPTTVPEGLTIGAITEREDPRDAIILKFGDMRPVSTLQDLSADAVVGTSSQRRMAQLKHARPDVHIREVRGNVDTRLRKLDEGGYDAIILASAGLRRLELTRRISLMLPLSEMLPAIGQGALGVQIRATSSALAELGAQLDHPETSAACTAERAFLRAMGGGCQLPIAGHAQIIAGVLKLEGLVGSSDGARLLRESIEGPASDATRLGAELGQRMLKKGAGNLLSN
jgi:hydroxymethylbilane synthase